LIKYIKSVLWRVAKRLSYIQDARCLKVKENKAKENAISDRQTRLTFQTVIIDHSFSLRRPYRPGLKRRTWPFNCSSATEINLRIYRKKICNSITYSMYMSKH